jgi:hypothetical protein
MRVSGDADDDIVRGLEQGFRRFADDQGFSLASIFYEYHSGSYDAFDRLAETLRSTKTRHVVVPSIGHLSGSLIISNQLLMRLEMEAKAEVHELDEQ